jgi:hypothetical protein
MWRVSVAATVGARGIYSIALCDPIELAFQMHATRRCKDV